MSGRCACDWVATGQLGTIDFLLLDMGFSFELPSVTVSTFVCELQDHRGTIYHEADLMCCSVA